MPIAEFIESYPLYRKFYVEIPDTLNSVPKPRINMDCEICKDRRTFSMVNEYYDGRGYSNYPSEGSYVTCVYKCLFCLEFRRLFFLIVAEDGRGVTKVGQFPPWSVKPDKDISRMLGTHKDYLSKGLVCESQSYGIAAFSYYRRITEEIIDGLLNQIADLISDEDRATYNSALDAVKNTRVASEKIELVKDLLPPSLRPDGINPLSLLHGTLSEGLHAQSDEECLKLAVEVREILTFLATQVAAAKESSRLFTERMRSLLDKRSK